jgi:hypothetical protein|nr:MAG TPA: hypothetical protein [Crassvirales sp.]
MGKIRVIKEGNLRGATDNPNDKIYPVTTSEAVYVPGVGKLTEHVHPRIIVTEAEMDELIAKGQLKEGYDYAIIEDE